MSWSPFAASTLNDPGNGHRQLLDACPVHRFDGFDPPFYTLSKYADVEAALRDIETFSSHYGQGPRFTEPVGMLCDPPQHTRYRHLVQQAFTPRRIEALRAPIVLLTDQLIDEVLAAKADRFDLHDDLAFPLPVIIIARMLGVPTADLDRFKFWSDVSVAAMGAPDPTRDAADQADFMRYMQDHVRARRRAIERGEAVPEDLLTVIAGPQDEDGWLPEIDVLSMFNQLLVGGNETTTSLITNAVWRLLQNRPLWLELVDDPELAEPIVEESLRFDPPVLGLYRNTTRAVTLHGETIPEGSKVLLNYAAANRDPAVFSDPDRFDPHRPRQRHLAFGLGVHFCLGAPMARLEAEIALRALARRIPDLRLLGDGERITPFFLWGRRKLPVAAR